MNRVAKLRLQLRLTLCLSLAFLASCATQGTGASTECLQRVSVHADLPGLGIVPIEAEIIGKDEFSGSGIPYLIARITDRQVIEDGVNVRQGRIGYFLGLGGSPVTDEQGDIVGYANGAIGEGDTNFFQILPVDAFDRRVTEVRQALGRRMSEPEFQGAASQSFAAVVPGTSVRLLWYWGDRCGYCLGTIAKVVGDEFVAIFERRKPNANVTAMGAVSYALELSPPLGFATSDRLPRRITKRGEIIGTIDFDGPILAMGRLGVVPQGVHVIFHDSRPEKEDSERQFTHGLARDYDMLPVWLDSEIRVFLHDFADIDRCPHTAIRIVIDDKSPVDLEFSSQRDEILSSRIAADLMKFIVDDRVVRANEISITILR